MKTLQKLSILAIIIAFVSCNKEKEIVNPEGNDFGCYTCETTFTTQNEKGEFVPIGDTLKSDHCDITSLGIARLQHQETRWIWYNGIRSKQTFTCKKK